MKKMLLTIGAVITAATAVYANTAETEEKAESLEKKDSVSAFLSVDIASGYISSSGSVVSDSLVVVPYMEVSFDAFDAFPLNFSVWANYATDKYKEMEQNHCFTEIDFSVGTSYEFDCGLGLAINLASWQYPNMAGWNGEEGIIPDVYFNVTEFFSLGLTTEYLISGDSEGDVHLMPYVNLSTQITKDFSASLYGQLYYTHPDGSGEAGWSTYKIKATLSFMDFYVYGAYWGQIDDDIYVDEDHDHRNFVVGAGYGITL